MQDPKTLREAYNLYKENKMQRRDFVGQIVTAIEQLQSRIGAVDESAVAALTHRMVSVETTIGNALAHAGNGRVDEHVPAGLMVANDPPPSAMKKRKGWPKGKPRKAKTIEDATPVVAGD